MSEHPKFVCARIGHDPEVTVRNTGRLIGTYLTRCKRCGVTLRMRLDG